MNNMVLEKSTNFSRRTFIVGSAALAASKRYPDLSITPGKARHDISC